MRTSKTQYTIKSNNLGCYRTKEGRVNKVAETMGRHCEGSAVEIILSYG
jgi:hypothetical protein